MTGTDTLNSIATNLAAGINANSSFQSLQITAVAAGPSITLSSTNIFQYNWNYFLNGTATETVTLASQAQQTAIVTIGGSPTLLVTYSGFRPTYPGHRRQRLSPSPTLSSSTDTTTAAVATGLVNAINSDTTLQAFGLTASNTKSGSPSPIITLISQSQITESYIIFTQSGGSVTMALSVMRNQTVQMISSLYNSLYNPTLKNSNT